MYFSPVSAAWCWLDALFGSYKWCLAAAIACSSLCEHSLSGSEGPVAFHLLLVKESLSLMKESRFAENLRWHWFHPLCNWWCFLSLSVRISTLARVHGYSCSGFSCYSLPFPNTVDEMIKLEWGLQKSLHRGGYRS